MTNADRVALVTGAARGLGAAITPRLAAAGHPVMLADVLVNNAGTSPKVEGCKRLVEDIPPDEWRRVLDVNLTDPFLLSRVAIPVLKERRWGRMCRAPSPEPITARPRRG